MLLRDFKACIKSAGFVTIVGAQVRFEYPEKVDYITIRWTGQATGKEFFAHINQESLDLGEKTKVHAIKVRVFWFENKTIKYSEHLIELEFWNKLEMPI